MVLAVVGIVAFSSEVQPVDSVSTDHEALPVLSSNLHHFAALVRPNFLCFAPKTPDIRRTLYKIILWSS